MGLQECPFYNGLQPRSQYLTSEKVDVLLVQEELQALSSDNLEMQYSRAFREIGKPFCYARK